MKKIVLPSTDRLLGLSAMLISLLTLIIFMYQTSIINEQSRLSVKPMLAFNSIQSISSDSVISFSQILKNKGLGPAIISKSKIIYKEKEYQLDFEAFFNKVYPKIEDYGELITVNSVLEKGILSSGEDNVLFSYRTKISEVPKLLAYLQIHDMEEELPWEIKINYTSMYEEEWKASNKGTK